MNWRRPPQQLKIGWPLIGGPLVTLAMATGIELFAKAWMTGPQPRPLPALLGFSVIMAALLGGLRPALVSACLAWLYVFLRVSPEGGRTFYLVAVGIAYPLITVLVTMLRSRLLKASRLEAERDAARTRAIELESLVAERTRALVAAQEAQRNQAERIRALYEVSSMPGVSVDEQILALLRWGCQLLGMEHGAVARLDLAEQRCTITHLATPSGQLQEPGSDFPLADTYAPVLIERGGPLAIEDSNIPPWNSLPACQALEQRAFLGDLIVLNGEPVAMLHFASNAARQTPFEETDQDLVRLMSRWVGSALERQDARARLEEAYCQLQEINRLKDEFLSTVSHEFRTPLTAIKAAAWILEQRLEGELNASQEGIVSIVITHADHLHRMINDFLDLSKMETGELRYKHAEGDLARLAREVAVSLSQLFSEKDIELALELDVETATAVFDHDRIRQVLLNLLSNAAKFTSRGGKVTLRLIQEEASVRLEVEDTGIGVAPEHAEKIFQKFYQVDGSSTRTVGGTGLGLAICRSIVEEGHHGRIWVESALSEGSTFIVTLPTLPRTEASAINPSL